MRIIKFRGTRIDNGEFVFGDLLQQPTCRIVNADGEFEIKPESVAQLAGFDCATGEEIYSGDEITIYSCIDYENTPNPSPTKPGFTRAKKLTKNIIACVYSTAEHKGNTEPYEPQNGMYFWLNAECSGFRWCLLKNFDSDK